MNVHFCWRYKSFFSFFLRGDKGVLPAVVCVCNCLPLRRALFATKTSFL